MSDELALVLKLGGVALAFPLLAWAIGTPIVGRLTQFDREERFVASFGVGFAALAVCAFTAFVLHAPQPYFNLGGAVVMLGIALWCRLTTPKRPAETGPSTWPLAAIFTLAYLHLVAIQILLPAYRGSYWYFDWYMHYNEAQIFVGDEAVTRTWANGYTVASRTPLFNLATAFVMGSAGHGFDIYQLASAATNICFVLPLFLLLRDLFGRRAAWLALFLVPLNLWMLHNAWFTWPKMLATYYLVLALHFYLQSMRQRGVDPLRAANYFVGFLIAGLLGYLTHQAVALYILPLLLCAVVLALYERALPLRLHQFLAAATVVAVLGGTWYAWLVGNLGMDKVLHSTPASLGDDKATFSPRTTAGWMGYNLSMSVFPVGIYKALVIGVAPDADAPPNSVEIYRGAAPWFFDDDRGEQRWFIGAPNRVALHRGVTQLYFSLLTGALTLSLCLFLLDAGLRRLLVAPGLSWTKPPPNRPAVWVAVWLCLLGGTLGGAALHPGKIPWGIAHSAIYPTAVLLAALGWGVLSRARTWVAALVCCGMVLEFAVMFWSHWWLLFHNPEILEPDSSGEGIQRGIGGMLNETLGGSSSIFLAGAFVLQVALVVGLFLCLRRGRAAAPEATR